MRKHLKLLIFVMIAGLVAAAFSGSIIAKTNTKAKKGRVLIKNYSFKPGTIRKKGPAKITWTNKDSTNHTVTADDGSFDSGDLAKGKAFTTTLTKGAYKYHCEYHSTMTGTLIIR